MQNLDYTYDKVGNITQIEDASDLNSAKTTEYQYDDLHHLTRASSTNAVYGGDYLRTYVYNAIGNITNKSDQGNYGYEGNTGTRFENPHAATSIGGANYTYDNNGNLTSDGVWTHIWDYDNRLIQSTNGTTTIGYTYDQDGNRLTYSDGIATTTYVNKYFSVSNTGTTTKNIFLGDQLIATIEGNGIATSTYYIHTDHLTGSNVITDEDGQLAQLIDYYPFGDMRLNEKSGDFDEKKKFTGHEHDNETDLEYMLARYYNGNVGRFISIDPLYQNLVADKRFLETLLNPQLMNSYSYSGNNPIIYKDPTGESTITAWLFRPFITTVQMIGWLIGSTALQKNNPIGSPRPISSALMNHSLSVNPKPITVTAKNQSDYGNMIDAIKGSGEYKNLVNGLINNNSDKGVINYGPGSKNYEPLVFKPSSGDLFSSIHGTTGTEIKGTKDKNGNWNLSVTITDVYDYKPQLSKSDYQNNTLFNSLNNAAYLSQQAGTISNYGITVKFNDQQKGGGGR